MNATAVTFRLVVQLVGAAPAGAGGCPTAGGRPGLV